MNNNENLSFFEQLGVTEEVVKAKREEGKIENKDGNKTENKKSKPTKKIVTKSQEEQIEEDLKNNPPAKLILKVFGDNIKVFEGEEIKSIKLNDILKSLIEEFNYGEFIEGCNWHLTKGKDNLESYLIPMYKFQPKG